MTMTLTDNQKVKIKELPHMVLKASSIAIRFLVIVIGNIVASFPAVPQGNCFIVVQNEIKLNDLVDLKVNLNHMLN